MLIDEHSLSRLYQHVVEKRAKSWGIITAHRASNTKKQNKEANQTLEKDLREKGLGFFKMRGHWTECQDKNVAYKDCPKDKLVDTAEDSYFVPNIKQEDLHTLCKKYDQDGVVYGDNNGNTKLLFKGGDTQNLGKFRANVVNQAYSTIKKGKSFSFDTIPTADTSSEKKSEPIKLKPLLPKDILNTKVKNPQTGRLIQMKSALNYDRLTPVYKLAKQMIKKKIAE